ncbi:DUF1345 domain-containing protein [Mucilaginibacter achroorhodeus]|uniref:DUF1345 domain-containing protein n=1 Tax=Mucilaginibacter achroorhodeus TaxID=2599294 RepID=A0A563U7H2_9SPHI|nr:DUF1345 domain-containing protein [Mucilaginibacter achroorhodeus]TWR27296.1 DUF1345 domain-containing protein [Mucilaginibacter achroorhodeus]
MVTRTKPNKQIIFRVDAHYRLIISLAVGVVAFFLSRHLKSVPEITLITWIGIATSIIILDWVIILGAHPREIRKIASLEDSSRTLIFLVVLASSLVSLVAIYLLLRSSKDVPEETTAAYIILAMVAVVISWWLVHTIFTMRYAHLYYNKDSAGKEAGGLDFPGDMKDPDYLDFVYFSFVIGMTFQVSDVEISSRRIRRLAWMHGLISFAFNTAIVALSINVISGLVSK